MTTEQIENRIDFVARISIVLVYIAIMFTAPFIAIRYGKNPVLFIKQGWKNRNEWINELVPVYAIAMLGGPDNTAEELERVSYLYLL